MVKNANSVSMRVRIGENELEVSGPPAFVEAKIQEFLSKQRAFAPSAAKPGKSSTGLVEPGEKGPTKKTSAAQFFNKANARTDVERALLAGYYIEKYQNQESFTSIDVRDVIRSAKRNPPTNPSDTIAKNIRKGYMMPAGDKEGKMAFVLTSDGEEAVEEAVKQD